VTPISPNLRLVPAPSRELPERSDDELMQLAQGGTREAFAVLVERYAQRLVQVCARFVNDAELGLELAQETWVSVWLQRARYRAEGRFVLWLISVARNRCRNRLRQQGVVQRHAQRERALASDAVDEIDRLLVDERQRQVRDALAHVPERMREALLLRYAEELRYDEMAELLRVGESTLRSRVHHGLRLLRELLEKVR
jgi:RNA polymerase sigma-70 factor (ECF subfamily)